MNVIPPCLTNSIGLGTLGSNFGIGWFKGGIEREKYLCRIVVVVSLKKEDSLVGERTIEKLQFQSQWVLWTIYKNKKYSLSRGFLPWIWRLFSSKIDEIVWKMIFFCRLQTCHLVKTLKTNGFFLLQIDKKKLKIRWYIGFWRLRGCAPRGTRPSLWVRRAAARLDFLKIFFSPQKFESKYFWKSFQKVFIYIEISKGYWKSVAN